jgi:hypothetical protein
VPTNSSQLTDQLTHLPAAAKEDILDFFSQDLRTLDARMIAGNLEMVMMFMNEEEAGNLKKQIFAELSDENRLILPLIECLTGTTSVGADQPKQLLHNGEKVQSAQMSKKVSVHPEDYVQTSFPKNDHFDFTDMQDVDKFRAIGAIPFSSHQFGDTLNLIARVLPEEIESRLKKDQLLWRRLESVILTYLKDIRDRMETFSRLVANEKEGGVGLDHETVERIFEVLDGKIKKKERLPLQKIHIISEDTAATKQEGNEEDRQMRKTPIQNVQKVTDIIAKENRKQKVAPRVVDPVEFYGTLSLEDIRREQTPEEFARKIQEKIQSESVDDYAHKIKTISAWKRSPLCKLYLGIGRQSLTEGLSVAAYLMKKTGENVMTYQEFEAIGELNRKLRF